MLQSPVLRAVLIVALLLFCAFCLQIAWAEGGKGTWLLIAMALASLTFITGLMFPTRQRLALRVVAGGVVLLYLVYFCVELVALLRGGVQPIRFGQPSAIMAGVGVLVWGIPLLVYSLSGRTLREHAAAEAIAADRSGALRDRQALDALVRSGVDLEISTEVRFFLELPSEGHARSAVTVAGQEGFLAVASPQLRDEGVWMCSIEQHIAPTWDNIRSARARFEELATALGGTVVGWEITS